ncbi:hypothetical protein J6590_036470 [Homalodisca vitripennis]|nr:hypothetical protein J6590_036470 [Homalodisca vitripennis]
MVCKEYVQVVGDSPEVGMSNGVKIVTVPVPITTQNVVELFCTNMFHNPTLQYCPVLARIEHRHSWLTHSRNVASGSSSDSELVDVSDCAVKVTYMRTYGGMSEGRAVAAVGRHSKRVTESLMTDFVVYYTLLAERTIKQSLSPALSTIYL